MKLFVIHFPKVMYGYYLNLTFNVKNAFFLRVSVNEIQK